MENIINELVDRGYGDMKPRIGRCIINVYFAIFTQNPSIAKNYIRDITDALIIFRCNEISSGPGYNFRRIFQVGHKHIEDISQAGSCVAHTMCQLEPPFGGFNRSRSQAVLDFFYRMICSIVDDGLAADNRMLYSICQSPADAASGACLDKAVLRSRVKSIFSLNHFRMEHYIPLLRRLCGQIGQTFPFQKILRSDYAALSQSR